MTSERSTEIKAEAARLGFSVCGIAKAEPVEEAERQHFRQWIEGGKNAEMRYMENHEEVRLDPRLLLDGAKSIICVALNYTPRRRIDERELQIAAYAYGQDYHDIVRQMLRELADNCRLKNYRVCCDTAPILERYWAQKAGIGWKGRNHLLIVPGVGSQTFLGEIITDEELCYDQPAKNRCANCRACIDACPMGAINEEGEIDANRCLSYQTIENRGELTDEAKRSMGNSIYGCDRCQQACHWNRKARPTEIPQLQPNERLLTMTRQQWQHLSEDDYRQLFKGSAVKRAKYSGLMRNIEAASGETKE